MKVFKQVNFKRDYECTNVVAIVADKLPEKYSPDVFKLTDDPDALHGLSFLWSETRGDKRIEMHGYL